MKRLMIAAALTALAPTQSALAQAPEKKDEKAKWDVAKPPMPTREIPINVAEYYAAKSMRLMACSDAA